MMMIIMDHSGAACVEQTDFGNCAKKISLWNIFAATHDTCVQTNGLRFPEIWR